MFFLDPFETMDAAKAEPFLVTLARERERRSGCPDFEIPTRSSRSYPRQLQDWRGNDGYILVHTAAASKRRAV